MNQTETAARHFLTEAAQTVREFVKPTKQKRRFLEQAQKFQAQSDRVRKLLTGYIQDAAADPILKKYNEGCAPHDGWEYDDDLKIWRPPVPFEPWEYLTYHFANTFPPEPSAFESKPVEPNSDSDEGLMCQYVLLGIIHDNVRAVQPRNRLCGVLNEHFLFLFWQDLLAVFAGEKTRDTARAKVDEALHDVKADLDKKPAETEQEIAPAKRQRLWSKIKGMAVGLYAVAIERIVKAVLDKYG